MMRILSIILLLSMVFGGYSQEEKEDKDKLIKNLMATAALDFTTDLEKAIQTYTIVINLDTTYEQAYYMRAQAYYGQGQLKLSLMDIERVITLDPENAKAYALRGAIYKETMDYFESLKAYNQAVLNQPDNGNYYFARGSIHILMKQYWYGIKDMERAIDRGFKTADVFYEMAYGYLNIYDYTKAKIHYQNAMDLGKLDEHTYYFRGHCNLYLGENDHAIKDLNMALAFNEDYLPAIYDMAYIYMNQTRWDSAVYYYTRGLEINDIQPQALNNRGIAYRNLGLFDEALKDFSQAIQLKPNYPDPYLNRSLVYEEKKEYLDALTDLNTYLEFDPNNHTVLYARGRIKLLSLDNNGACADWENAAKLGNEQAKAALTDICAKIQEAEQ